MRKKKLNKWGLFKTKFKLPNFRRIKTNFSLSGIVENYTEDFGPLLLLHSKISGFFDPLFVLSQCENLHTPAQKGSRVKTET